jgi:hypothetical protein
MPKTYYGKKTAFFNKCFWENCISSCKKLKLDHVFQPVQVSTQSGLRTLTPKSLKLMQERAEGIL